MKIGQLNQLLNPANSFKAGNNKPFMPTIQNNADSYSGDKSKLAAKFLDDKLAEALGIEKKPEKEKPLFDFESIVKNVLDFVKGAVNKAKANGKDDNELRNMLGEARKGVKLGIDEATDALKESSVFNNEIEEGIEKSREGIFSGLDEFEKSLFEPQPDKMSVTSAQYASLSNQADYSFTTAEGDEVVISFSDAYSQNKGASYNKEGNNEGVAYAEENKQEVSFSISVNGDLNEDEEKLVNRFARKLDITEAEYKEIVENSKKYPVVPQAKTDDRLERLLDLFKIIYSDHEIDEAELKLILRYAIQLGVSQERAEEIISKTTKVFSGKIDLDQYKSILSIL